MEHQTNYTDIQTTLDDASNAIVKNGVKTGGVIKAYSVAMDNAFDMTLANGEVVKWFALTGKTQRGESRIQEV